MHLSDDNFTVYRRRTHALLAQIAALNGANGREPMTFITQVSIDLARDETALKLSRQAGLRYGLVGLETDSTAARQESLKRQNLRVDLVRETETLVRAGMAVSAGLTVGFDSDDTGCFARQLAFAMALPVINFNISALTAPVTTPLYAKMKAQGRIVGDPAVVDRVGSGTSVSNMKPLRMTSAELVEGTE
ncbi:MAG: hypothetical protein ROR55_09720 [Devosia sp.]